MQEIARQTDDERRVLFNEASIVTGISAAVIEKDFWVCWMLNYLFQKSACRNYIAFKGGTCLSKAYHLTDRFSEDIDVVLDWRILGYEFNEPWEQRSNTQQEKFVKSMTLRTAEYLKNSLCPAVKEDVLSEIAPDCRADLYIDPRDDQTVVFSYPHMFSGMGFSQEIRLEIGPLAAWTPVSYVKVSPYMAEILPEAFTKRETVVRVVTAERIFWEKTAVLHREANRPESSRMPSRYSRHYYDLYRMSDTSVQGISDYRPRSAYRCSQL